MSVNPKGQAMCCLSCGRDTKSKAGYCYRCNSHVLSYGTPRGQAKLRDPKVIGGDPTEDQDTEVPRSDLYYHGDPQQ